MRAPLLLLATALLSLCPSARALDSVEIDAVPPQAVKRFASVQVRVSPDHRDWTYKPGEKVSFRVTVVADQEPISNVPITYTVGPEMMPVTEVNAVVPLEGLVIDGGTLQVPGFLRLSVKARIADREYKGAATAAYDPQLIQPTQVEPADFDAFWAAGKAELAATPADLQQTLLPERCTDKVNVYQVSFRTIGGTWEAKSRIFGILCEPKAPGKYPALLRVPGAGIRPYAGDITTAERGVITLEIGIHGIPVTLPKEFYAQLYAGSLGNYWTFNLDNKNTFFYRRVYLGCLRANDVLTSHPAWDGKNLMVAGASQGGQLSLVTAGLDPRVTALSVTHPAGCDLTGPLHGRAGGWPHPFRNWDGTPVANPNPEKIATTAYYDGVNFARRIKAPGFYNWGYNDDVCPPTSCYAAYNVITAPKELALSLSTSHEYPPEQWDIISAFIARQLGLK
jgi:cephalosporin-C deacetylase-like acetyl esterase